MFSSCLPPLSPFSPHLLLPFYPLALSEKLLNALGLFDDAGQATFHRSLWHFFANNLFYFLVVYIVIVVAVFSI